MRGLRRRGEVAKESWSVRGGPFEGQVLYLDLEDGDDCTLRDEGGVSHVYRARAKQDPESPEIWFTNLDYVGVDPQI